MKKRTVSLLIAFILLFSAIPVHADGNSGGVGRTGETITWIANGSGGTVGYSDTITVNDEEDDENGSYYSGGGYDTASSSFSYYDAIQEQIGKALRDMASGKDQISTVFYDPVNGRYIYADQMEFSPAQIAKIIEIAKQYQTDKDHVQSLTDAAREQQVKAYQDWKNGEWSEVNNGMFDPSQYGPGELGMEFPELGSSSVKKPQIGTGGQSPVIALDPFPTDYVHAEVQTSNYVIVNYVDYMKKEFGADIFDLHPEYKDRAAISARETINYYPIHNDIALVYPYTEWGSLSTTELWQYEADNGIKNDLQYKLLVAEQIQCYAEAASQTVE